MDVTDNDFPLYALLWAHHIARTKRNHCPPHCFNGNTGHV